VPSATILLLTPPLIQANAPYPATAVLAASLRARGQCKNWPRRSGRFGASGRRFRCVRVRLALFVFRRGQAHAQFPPHRRSIHPLQRSRQRRDQVVVERLGEGMPARLHPGAVGAEPVVGGIGDHAGTDGIELDVGPAGPEGGAVLQHRVLEAASPEGAAPPDGARVIVPDAVEVLEMPHAPAHVAHPRLPGAARPTAGAQRPPALVEGRVALDGLRLRWRFSRGLQQQVIVVGHHLIRGDAHRVEGGHAVQNPDELLLLGIVERTILPRADRAVVAVVPRILAGGFESGMAHGGAPVSRWMPYMWRPSPIPKRAAIQFSTSSPKKCHSLPVPMPHFPPPRQKNVTVCLSPCLISTPGSRRSKCRRV